MPSQSRELCDRIRRLHILGREVALPHHLMLLLPLALLPRLLPLLLAQPARRTAAAVGRAIKSEATSQAVHSGKDMILISSNRLLISNDSLLGRRGNS